MTFSYDTKINLNLTIISLKGDLIDPDQASDLLNAVDVYVKSKSLLIILDLGELNYVNSSGLNVLIKILTKVRKAGGEVSIINVNKKINDLLVITKLNSVFNICNNIEEASTLLRNK